MRMVLGIFVLVGCNRGELPVGTQPATLANSYAIVTSDYTTGELLLLHPAKEVVRIPIHGDSRAVISDLLRDALIVVGRQGRDSLLFLDRKTGSVLGEQSVGLGTNAQDVLFLDSEIAVVSRYQSNRLWFGRFKEYHLSESKEVAFGGIEEGSDKAAEVSSVTRVGKYLLVAVQHLSDETFLPLDKSKIISIDVSDPWNPREVSQLSLKCQNPVTEFQRVENLSQSVFIGGAGQMGFYSKLDGCIERVDVDETGRLVSIGPVVTEEILRGDIVDFEMASPTSGVALVAASQTESRAVAFGENIKLDEVFLGRGADLFNLGNAGFLVAVGDSVHGTLKALGAELPFKLPSKSLPPQQVLSWKLK